MKYVYLVKVRDLQTNETFLSSIVSSEAKATQEVEFWNQLQIDLHNDDRVYYYIKEPVY